MAANDGFPPLNDLARATTAFFLTRDQRSQTNDFVDTVYKKNLKVSECESNIVVVWT